MMSSKRELNPLFITHSQLVDLAGLFRARVCRECGWSEATYYRRMKIVNKGALSNAEREKIRSVAIELVGIILTHCSLEHPAKA